METFSALLAICAGNSPVPGEFPSQRPVTRSFDVSFDLRSNIRLSKQWRGWWFETQSCPLWRHRNETFCDRMELFKITEDIVRYIETLRGTSCIRGVVNKKSHNHFAWVSCCPKLPTIRLFFHTLFRVNIKKTLPLFFSMEWIKRFCGWIYQFSISLILAVLQRQKTYRVLALLPKMLAAWLPWDCLASNLQAKAGQWRQRLIDADCLASMPWATGNGSWCMGIKGEMSGTVFVTFTWDMYIWFVYSFCLSCCLFIIVKWWYVWCIVWASGRVGGQFNSGIGIVAQF